MKRSRREERRRNVAVVDFWMIAKIWLYFIGTDGDCEIKINGSYNLRRLMFRTKKKDVFVYIYTE